MIEFCVNDVLIGNIRPYLRKIWIADVNGGTNGDVLVLQVIQDKKISPRFLFQVLSDERFFEYAIQHSKGAKMPRGDKQKILEFKIPIPDVRIQNISLGFLTSSTH